MPSGPRSVNITLPNKLKIVVLFFRRDVTTFKAKPTVEPRGRQAKHQHQKKQHLGTHDYKPIGFNLGMMGRQQRARLALSCQ